MAAVAAMLGFGAAASSSSAMREFMAPFEIWFTREFGASVEAYQRYSAVHQRVNTWLGPMLIAIAAVVPSVCIGAWIQSEMRALDFCIFFTVGVITACGLARMYNDFKKMLTAKADKAVFVQAQKLGLAVLHGAIQAGIAATKTTPQTGEPPAPLDPRAHASFMAENAKTAPVARIVRMHPDDFKDPITFEPYADERIGYALDNCFTNPVLATTLDMLYGRHATNNAGKNPFTNRRLETITKVNMQCVQTASEHGSNADADADNTILRRPQLQVVVAGMATTQFVTPQVQVQVQANASATPTSASTSTSALAPTSTSASAPAHAATEITAELLAEEMGDIEARYAAMGYRIHPPRLPQSKS